MMHEPNEADKAAATEALKELTEQEADKGRDLASGILMAQAIAKVTLNARAKAHNDQLGEFANLAGLTGLYLGTLEAAIKIAGMLKALQPEVAASLESAARKFNELLPKVQPAEITIVHEENCTCPDHAKEQAAAPPRGTTPKKPNDN